jgi:hypothetical protein
MGGSRRPPKRAQYRALNDAVPFWSAYALSGGLYSAALTFAAGRPRARYRTPSASVCSSLRSEATDTRKCATSCCCALGQKCSAMSRSAATQGRCGQRCLAGRAARGHSRRRASPGCRLVEWVGASPEDGPEPARLRDLTGSHRPSRRTKSSNPALFQRRVMSR